MFTFCCFEVCRYLEIGQIALKKNAVNLLLVQRKYQHVKVYSKVYSCFSDHDNILYLNRIWLKLIMKSIFLWQSYFCTSVKWSVRVYKSTENEGTAVMDIFVMMVLDSHLFMALETHKKLSQGWHSRRWHTSWNWLIHNLSVVFFTGKNGLKKIISNTN